MPHYSDYSDETEDDNRTWAPMKTRMYPAARRKRAEVRAQLAERPSEKPEGSEASFARKFIEKTHMSNHEREWIVTYLGGFYDDQLIVDVLRRVKGGKEATVYCCQAGPEMGVKLIAGKVYHERSFRNLKNDSLYREGRDLTDMEGNRGRREARAMKKRTQFGQQLRHASWLGSEFEMLSRLYAAGGDVPQPFAQSDNAILMEYLGTVNWPAPALQAVKLQQGEARPLFDRLVGNLELMLAHDCVHADLSAYNILYWGGEVKIIDFPQAVNPYVNPVAYTLFERDVTRICQYFARYGINADSAQLAAEIWARQIPT